jgi:hypothetical protein
VTINEDQAKAALKEALKEWMDDKFATFGKWSFAAIGIALVSMIVYFLLLSNGWTHIPR